MRLLFIVQGEGRGHLTQAVALAELLQLEGHQVVGAWVNIAPARPVPDFFAATFPAPIIPVAGPLMIYDSVTNAFDLGATLRLFFRDATLFRRSLIQIRDAINEHKPDIVVNFFKILGGLTYGLYRPAAPMVCIGHQFMSLHPVFPFPKGQWVDKLLFRALVQLTSWRARTRIGLSFDEQPDLLTRKLRVVPPLLRRELLQPKEVTNNTPVRPFVLAYTTQSGLLTEVIKAHLQCLEIPIHYFFSQAQKPQEQVSENLFFHQIDSSKYLDAMRNCRAVLTTAGFESVCEALYLSKPVLMMPQLRHYEQAGNALDGERAGAGIAANEFDLQRLLNYIPHYRYAVGANFRSWYVNGKHKLIDILQETADTY